jgi:8-oxo-dGTP pyrophosphatase MutT (NUDIX family)
MNLSKKALHRPSILYQAAVLPWRLDRQVEIMLITSLGTGRWVLPKGTLMPGESPRMAARREALEEAGLEGELTARPLGSFYYEKRLSSRGPRQQLCSVSVYPLKVEIQRDQWPERGLRKFRWFALADAAAAVKEDELRDLLLGFDSARPTVSPRRSA